MHKRFLAILAIVATIFAFGVGSALADKPEDAGKQSPHPACEKDNPPEGCADNGHPDDPDGDDDDDGDDDGDDGTPAPQDLCDALRGLDPNLEPIAAVCDAVVAALTGGGEPPAEEPPAEEPGERPAPCGEFEQIPQIGGQVADGCAQVVGNLPAAPGGEEPPAEEPPAEEPGERPAPCGELEQIPQIGGQVADGCAQLVGALPTP